MLALEVEKLQKNMSEELIGQIPCLGVIRSP